MNSAREEILGRIRCAVGGSPTESDDLERNYRRTGSLDSVALVELFADRLRDYGAGVHCCEANGIAATVAEVLDLRGRRRLLTPSGIWKDWLPAGFEFITDQELSHNALDESDGAITGCTAAIAATGSILLTHRDHEGRRALSLIPDYHLCVVFSDQIVETVPEGIARLAPFSHNPITTIAGPSATADIEMIRVKGVHGPRTLDVIIASACRSDKGDRHSPL